MQHAWIGDAVLTLYARAKVLREQGQIDANLCVRMTSNQFLNSLGEPSRVEAKIGEVYEREGLAAAFDWIDGVILPMFERQEAKRRTK